MKNWSYLAFGRLLSKLPLILILFSYPSYAGIARTLNQYSVFSGGHDKVEKLDFSRDLKASAKSKHKKFRREVLAQFLRDRIYISKVLEKILVQNSQRFDLSKPEDRIFFRSFAYQEELLSLVGPFRQIEVSDTALEYGAALEGAKPGIAFLHLWAVLSGDTHGTQSWASYMKKNYPSVGSALTYYDGLTLAKVRDIYDLWIEKNWDLIRDDIGQNGSYQQIINNVYEHSEKLLNAANTVQRVSLCNSLSTVFSQQCYACLSQSTKNQINPKTLPVISKTTESKKEERPLAATPRDLLLR